MGVKNNSTVDSLIFDGWTKAKKMYEANTFVLVGACGVGEYLTFHYSLRMVLTVPI